ncbi:hypothetical protein GKQ23_05925 [Erwinia sp. E602]|uniref:hypothetical protein n=1 Tax=Erwinia sp. E602 TaxID=2675378 RepID=UPI001BA6E2AF|nr:hypothetical protein [Erwinia sp. E602]QUG74572.1 hypothetical protein GKQ23_05925 [Erwinia sp. E602]
MDLTENFHEIPLTGCRVPDNNNPSVGNYEFTTNATATLTAKLTNIASTQKSIKIKDISIMHLDKNHHHDDRFLLNGEITLPPASRCSISAPATLTLPDVGASSLGSAPPGNGAGASVAVPVTLECPPASTATLTLNTPKADNGCIGTDLPGYAICVDDVDLSTGGAKLGGIQNGVKELWLRGGRGSGKVTPGVGTGTLTVTATPP